MKRSSILSQATDTLLRKRKLQEIQSWYITRSYSNNNNWGLDEIRERDIRISDELVEILKDWGLNQSEANIEELLTFIPEERFSDYLDFIKIFKMEDTNESREKFLSI